MNRVLEKQEKIEVAYQSLTSALEKVNNRRKLWVDETKNNLVETLTLIKDLCNLDGTVQIIDDLSNYQTINISFRSKNSGIVETKQDFNSQKVSKKAFVKHGGYIAFCQSYNGKVNIIIGFPYIDEWVEKMDTESLDTVEPEQITEELISEKVIIFFERMAEWEGKDRKPLGYK